MNRVSFIRKQSAFFIPVLLYFFTGVILLFLLDKGDLIRFFSDNRTEFWNTFFKYGTQLGEEYTYLISFIVLLFIRFRFALFLPLVAGLTAVLSISLKSFLAHPRPKPWFTALNEELTYVADVYVNVSMTSSFPSGHTFSGFAVFGFLALISDRAWLKALFASCAIIVGVSRVYLVQHFLEDVVFGAFLGTALAIGLYWLQSKLSDDSSKWWNKNLFNFST